ncbi:MAG: MBL fold metallo-hydrolase [Anaerovoracaceae bacterium]
MKKVEIEKIREDLDIYKINVPLPENPLKNLNAYVIKTPTKNLIIDTGFNRPESKEALFEGLRLLDINMDNTEIYVTHLHADHIGLINEIMKDDTIIYMSQRDYQYMYKGATSNGWEISENRLIKNGFPIAEIMLTRETNPARIFGSSKVFPVKLVGDGDIINVGDFALKVIFVPGHTPGNTCLYLESEKILFSGDHVLFDITPNITAWNDVLDPLGEYLDSLNKVKALDVKLVLPGHRKNDMDFYERVEQLLKHHKVRLDETLKILREDGPDNAYNIAAKMTWSMRGKKWEEFPVHQKWFAVGETLAHLDYLKIRGYIRECVDNNDDIIKYQIVEQ